MNGEKEWRQRIQDGQSGALRKHRRRSNEELVRLGQKGKIQRGVVEFLLASRRGRKKP